MGTEDNREAENRRERENASRQRYSARQPRSRHGSRRQAGRHEGVPTLEGLGRRLMKITHITAHVNIWNCVPSVPPSGTQLYVFCFCFLELFSNW